MYLHFIQVNILSILLFLTLKYLSAASPCVSKCLTILEPVFKLISHDALANINDNEVMEYVRHVNFSRD